MLLPRFIFQQLLFCCIVFLYQAPGQDFGTVYTQYHHVALIDFADSQPIIIFWSLASLSRVMLFLRLAYECNNKRVNASSVLQAKNQPFRMSHSGIGWQASACLCWHIFVFLLSSSPSFPLPESLIQALSPVRSLFKPISGSQSLNSILSEPRANKMNTKHNINVWAMHFWHLQLESLFYLQRLPLFPYTELFFPPRDDVVTMWRSLSVEPSIRAT